MIINKEDEIKEHLFKVMQDYYKARSKAESLDKELKKARVDEQKAQLDYNTYLTSIENFYKKKTK